MRKFLSLLLMSVLAVSAAWAAESVFYTLEPVAGSDNGYATNEDITIDGITWNVTGNSTMIPWRIGGKNLSEINRNVYSKTAMGSAITKVELKVGTATAQVNSITFTVASDADFSNVIDTKSANFEANSTITFTPTSGTEWATGAYYKFTFNVTCGGSNQYVQFSAATFYKEAGDTPQPTTYSLTLPTGLTGGSVSSNVSNAASIAAGTSITVTATPEQGYVLDWMKANDTEVSNPYTFNIAENTTITAAFKEEGTTPDPSGPTTITFVQTSTSGGTLTGAPAGVTATFSTTYNNNMNQLTASNSMTLTLSGFSDDYYLTGVKLDVKNNKSSGDGTATVKVDNTEVGSLQITGLGNTYQEKDVTVTRTQLTGDIVITIAATANSVYCDKFEITVDKGGDTPQPSEFPAPTFSFQENTLVENGDAVIVLPENATSLNYWYGTDSQNAIDNVVDQTATSNVTLDLSQFTLRDYVYVNAQAIYADGESDIVSTALYVGDPDYEFPLVFVAEPTEGGTITGQATALGNEVVEFTVTPAEGYTLKKVEAKYTEFGNAYGGNDIVIDGNTFTMPAYSKIDVKNENRVFITATFEKEAVPGEDAMFDFDNDYATLFPESAASQPYEFVSDATATVNGVSATVSASTGGTKNRIWTGSPRLRMYNGTLTVTAPSGYEITAITFSSNDKFNLTPDEGTLTDKVWTGKAATVVFSCGGNTQLKNMNVTVAKPAEGELLTPVISGTTPFIGSTEITITNPNENGSIYYTIDGGDPTAEDALYSEPFTITETTTVKAVVVDGNDVSDVASKEFVRKAEVDNVPAFYELANNAEFVYSGSLMAIAQNGAYLYAQATDAADDEKGVLIYQSNLGQSYELGNVIPGGFGAKKTLYNGTVEMTNISGIQASTSSIEATPLELKPLQVTADIENRYVVVKGATLSAESSNYESSATVNGEAVEIYTKTLGVRIPDDFTGKTFDVYAVATMHNGISQLLPINFIETFTATVDPEIENGEVTILNEGTTFHEGDIIEFKVEPAQGYAIEDVRVEGVNTDQVIIPELADNIYTFQMPTDDVVIRVTFSEISTFTVTTEVTGEGSIQILNDGTAFHADDLIEFSVNPGEGYELDNLSVFCENINLAIEPNLEDDIYSFNMPVDNVIISASFRESVAPLWLIGNVNDVGWHTNNGAKMDYDAENEVYTLDITVENASEGFGWFGIVTALTENDNDWDNLNENRLSAGENNANDFAVNYRNHNNIALVPFSQAPHSFQLLMGNYTVIIDKELTTMQIVGEFNTPNYYLIGSYNGWANDDSKVQLEYNDETGMFEATQSMVANAEFKLIDDQGVWYGGDSNGNFIVTQEQVEKGTELTILAGGGNNLQIPVAGNWTFSFDDTNMKLVISGIWKNPTTLAEILSTADAEDEVVVANDLAIVDIVADQHIAFATDGEGNWIELSMDSDVLDFVEATPTLAGGSVKGMFIYDGFNPTIVIEEMPEAAENDLTIEPAVYPVNLDFAPKPCEIFYVTGYYHEKGGTDNGPNLREWSGNGGQMGVLLDLDISWARGSMEDGKHYKIRGTALLKEAWEAPSADGIRPRMATDDPMALRNYTIMATDIPDTPTAIETLVKNVEAKRVRYYNLQGVELNAPANGLNIIVIEHNDGSITTHKVLN